MIWIETGGDTGGAEVYCSDLAAESCRIDWDDWYDNPDQRPSLDDLISMMGGYGHIMPAATRRIVTQRIQQLVDQLQERYDSA